MGEKGYSTRAGIPLVDLLPKCLQQPGWIRPNPGAWDSIMVISCG